MSTNELVRIRLLNDTLKTLNGAFGTYTFTNGVSELMLRREAERLSMITTVEFIDAENLWERKSRERGAMNAAVVAAKPSEDESVVEVEQVQDAPAEAVQEAKKRYAVEDLEAIADKDGIRGLRDVGDSFGVRATSIRQMIDLIMQAQS
jgi:predicted xylose isomerase-like sugar epimerase